MKKKLLLSFNIAAFLNVNIYDNKSSTIENWIQFKIFACAVLICFILSSCRSQQFKANITKHEIPLCCGDTLGILLDSTYRKERSGVWGYDVGLVFISSLDSIKILINHTSEDNYLPETKDSKSRHLDDLRILYKKEPAYVKDFYTRNRVGHYIKFALDSFDIRSYQLLIHTHKKMIVFLDITSKCKTGYPDDEFLKIVNHINLNTE